MPEEGDALQRAKKLFAGPCDFVAGAASTDAIPPGTLPEFAFVGRSNAGKSSLINALTGRRALARISKTPGRTRQINFFELSGACVLADLPGYGYAKISKQMAADWQHLISAYLKGRASLRRVMLLIDARRGIGDLDRDVMDMLDGAAVSYAVVLTKTDTLAPEKREAARAQALAGISSHAAAYPAVLATSAETGEGLDALRLNLAALVSA